MMSLLLSLIFTATVVTSSPLLSWSNPTFSWFYSNNGVLDPDKIKLNSKIVSGRYLLKHNKYDGLDAVLEAYNLDDDGIAAVRDAKILSVISVSEEGEVRVATSDAEAEDTEANVVTFSPGVKANITNPLNGETVEFEGRALGPSMLRTKSRGLDTNILELKTWIFGPTGATVITEIVIEDEKLKIFAKQFMERVDGENKAKSLVLEWV